MNTKCLLLAALCFLPKMVFAAEMIGWINSDHCYAVKVPSEVAMPIGAIIRGSNVTVEDAGNGWLRLVSAQVKDAQSDIIVECTGCYIKADNFTKNTSKL